MNHTYRMRKLLMAASVALAGMAFASGAAAQSASGSVQLQPLETCSYSDPIQQAQCQCRNGQITSREQTSAQLAAQEGYDPYMQTARNVVPGNTSSYGAAAGVASQISQGCYGLSHQAFDSVFGNVAGLFGSFGGVFTTLMNGLVNSASGMLCQQVNNAVMSHTAIACPRVAIPGFPVNCNASLNVSANGVSVGSSGSLGGLTGSTGASSGLNGVGAINSVNNVTGGASTGPINVMGTATNAATSAAHSASSTAACWLTGSGC